MFGDRRAIAAKVACREPVLLDRAKGGTVTLYATLDCYVRWDWWACKNFDVWMGESVCVHVSVCVSTVLLCVCMCVYVCLRARDHIFNFFKLF